MAEVSESDERKRATKMEKVWSLVSGYVHERRPSFSCKAPVTWDTNAKASDSSCTTWQPSGSSVHNRCLGRPLLTSTFLPWIKKERQRALHACRCMIVVIRTAAVSSVFNLEPRPMRGLDPLALAAAHLHWIYVYTVYRFICMIHMCPTCNYFLCIFWTFLRPFSCTNRKSLLIVSKHFRVHSVSLLFCEHLIQNILWSWSSSPIYVIWSK